MDTYGYIRVSSEEQLKGDGVGRQKKKILFYTKSKKLSVTRTLIDEGLSAYFGANISVGELGKFINAVELGSIVTPCNLVVENTDRLSRDDPDEAQFNTLRLTRAGVVIHIIGGGKTTARILKRGMSMVDMIISTLEQGRSNDESAYKQDRLQSAWSSKRENAISSKKPMTSIAPGWIELVDDHYQLNKLRVDLIHKMLELYRPGTKTGVGVGANSIAATLNIQKIDTWGVGRKKGNRWYGSYIKKILANPALYGEYQPHRALKNEFGKVKRVKYGEPISGYYPAIITKEEFLELQDLKSSRRVKPGRKDATSKGVPCNLLPGLVYAREIVDDELVELKCSWTNKGRRKVSGGSRTAPRVLGEGFWIYYSPKHPRLGTKLSNYEYSITEQTILAALVELKDEDLIVAPTINIDPAQIEEKQLLQQKDTLQKQLTNFLDIIASGKAPSSILERIEELERQIKSIDVKLPTVRARKRLPEVGVAELSHNLDELKSLARGFDQNNLKAREVLRDSLAKILIKVVVSKANDKQTKGIFMRGLLNDTGMQITDPITIRKEPLYIALTLVGGAKRAIIAGLPGKEDVILSSRIKKTINYTFYDILLNWMDRPELPCSCNAVNFRI